MKQSLIEWIKTAATAAGISADSVELDYPENAQHGDFTTNLALAQAKAAKMPPKALAEKVAAELKKSAPDFITSIEIAGPGFINFKIKDEIFAKEVVAIAEWAASNPEIQFSPKKDAPKIMVEYTDPNPFKVFHIGHLMANAIGESISRLTEFSGAQVIRACYQGDVGLHVAKTIWAIQKKGESAKAQKDGKASTAADPTETVKWLGDMYVYGSQFDDDKEIQKEIAAVNKNIFDKSDVSINEIYQTGRKASLEYFDGVYKKLGTKFDRFFFESEVAQEGLQVVRDFLRSGVFIESEGATIFKGEDHGLHTRVFITSSGLPTYEAKELGLNTEKFKLYPDLTESIIVTANEQNDYFKVIQKVFSLTKPEIAAKTRHISHGILRFASGKMSSRKGNIISAEALIDEIKSLVMEKIAERKFNAAEADEVANEIAIGAIKYTILRSSVGSDIIFDSASSISFEGDSGPYLQYATVRAKSIIQKAQEAKIKQSNKGTIEQMPEKVSPVEKLISRFPDIVSRARENYAPQLVANYLISLAGEFNAFYAKQMIVDAKDPHSPYYVALTQAFVSTMSYGLWLLGIKVPKRM